MRVDRQQGTGRNTATIRRAAAAGQEAVAPVSTSTRAPASVTSDRFAAGAASAGGAVQSDAAAHSQLASIRDARRASRSATPSTVSRGARGADVQRAQQLLNAQGHKVSVDGAFGPNTEAAVRAFQQSRGLSADGIVGPKTWAALQAAAAPPSGGGGVLRRGANGPEVRHVQERLVAHGHAVGVDGDFGSGTEGAVRAFQSFHNLDVDGVVGPATRKALDAEPSASSNTTLRQGDRGAEVSELQRRLLHVGQAVGVDGIFGAQTRQAVLNFQRQKGLSADGVAGPQTWQALQQASGSAPVTPPSSGGDVKNVTGYASGRPFQLQVKSIGGGFYLEDRAANSFNAMRKAAARDGISLGVVSAFRTMSEQQQLWNKYGAPRAARPGYSNHQRGLATDISVNSSRNHPTYKWLAANAGRFGFAETVANEPWHWAYVR